MLPSYGGGEGWSDARIGWSRVDRAIDINVIMRINTTVDLFSTKAYCLNLFWDTLVFRCEINDLI